MISLLTRMEMGFMIEIMGLTFDRTSFSLVGVVFNDSKESVTWMVDNRKFSVDVYLQF